MKERYTLRHPVRIVTAASLFDGHDAAINIMRRILQAAGAEVIHLGHDRSVAEIVACAIAEDAQAIALTSYQGGHVEFLEYMHDLLVESGAGHIRIFAGGGGTILPSEIERLHAYGIERIYSPDDGRAMGLEGMIDDLLQRCDFAAVPAGHQHQLEHLSRRDPQTIARLITTAENHAADFPGQIRTDARQRPVPVLGITGTGGSGKSSLVDELVRRFLADFPDKTIAVVSVDPSKRKTGGALLGDRIRMNAVDSPRVYMRSLATRQANLALSRHVQDAIDVCKLAGFDLVIVETSGIGQSDTEITEHCDVALYVMTSEYGAATQLEKIDMLDFADLVAINKFDKPGSLDALRDVRRQVKRARGRFDEADDSMPVFGTIASQFGDPGTDRLYVALMAAVVAKTGANLSSQLVPSEDDGRDRFLIPARKARYLGDIVDTIERHRGWIDEQVAAARLRYQLRGSLAALRAAAGQAVVAVEAPDEGGTLRLHQQALDPSNAVATLEALLKEVELRLDPECQRLLADWPATRARWSAARYEFRVRDKVVAQDLRHATLAGLSVPKVALPASEDDGEILRFLLEEGLPGAFPYTGGVFPLKREGEDPTRMFAGEGGPERTNRRFHYLAQGTPAKRLSTAFDSVTLYGRDPDRRPDIWGKVGNSGVSVASVDDAKKLYSGFDLCNSSTSVSMTINGPAPMILAFFMNAAIDQRCERYLAEQGRTEEADRAIAAKFARLDQPRPHYFGDLPTGNNGLGLALLGASGDEVLDPETYGRLRAEALSAVRGTVQADILKEDQAQNTCIFSTEFALRLMGDVQQSFVDHDVRNFYSVSISGYHIAEAGANPISQLAFTLANGFTYVEYYLARGMHIDDFAPNLSFFFSNGMDPEYAVMGRVARRIWSRAMKLRYGGNDRSQKLKYHIQTSGRSLHAQEIAFNDIRTTLQALYAIYDNCNSLHTNAYDEAITTPTEESVRRAVAIQLIINRELGLAKNENPLQGAFIIRELTDLVEAAVLEEFRRIDARGGVLGAMERMYQRSRIQEESLLYESKKHTGELPIIGVNTYLSDSGSPTLIPAEVIRSTADEKENQLAALEAFQARNRGQVAGALEHLAAVARRGENTFEALLETAKVASLGQMSQCLFDVGGRYRRNM